MDQFTITNKSLQKMVSAIVLAAGLSSRMGMQNKLLLPINGKSMIRIVVDNILAAAIAEVIVVVGHEANLVKDQLSSLPIKFIYNENFEKGITSSIQKGVSMATGNGYMVCLADMPFVTAEEYKHLSTAFEKNFSLNKACIITAKYAQQKGNPVIFAAFYKNELLGHNETTGCKSIIDANKQQVISVDFGSNHILKDIDTPENYEQYRKSF